MKKTSILLLLLLSLGIIAAACTTSPAQGPSSASTPVTKPTATASKQESFDPAAYFKANCATCHGANAEGGSVGPALTKAKENHDKYVQTILNGKGKMPSFKGKLTEKQINQIVNWLANK